MTVPFDVDQHELVYWSNAIDPAAERPDRPGVTQTPAQHIAYVNAARGIISDHRAMSGLDLDHGVVVIGGTKEQYLAALDAMQAARDAAETLEDAVANEPPIDTFGTEVWEPTGNRPGPSPLR